MMVSITLITLGSLPGAVSAEGAFGNDIIQMIVGAGLMVKFVLLVLCLFSVVSWTIIFMKWRQLRKAKEETAVFLETFWETPELQTLYEECDDLIYSPVAHLFRGGYSEFKKMSRIQSNPESPDKDMAMQRMFDNVERILKRTTIDQNNRLESALSFLATTGNTTPFIGLFGTVWGIMESFQDLGLRGSASLAVVAPGISEALIATAAGLFAAIPAVIAFNYFSQKVLVLRAEMDTFTSDFLSLVGRHLLKKQMT
jgi:biopolymer transport protein TolQ